MAGLNDRRQLGTESGRIRRAARQVERAGGNPSALLNRAADAKLGEGSAISSSEDNAAFEEKKRRMQSGLLESKRRALLNPAGTPRTGMTPVERAEGLPYDEGTQRSVAQPARTAPSQTGTAPQPSLTAAPPSLMDSAAAADSRSLSRRKEMRAAEDSITGGEPGNLAGLANRDAQDRAAAITAARTESAGNPSVTRQGVIDRINKERTAKGLQPFGEDIYKDIAAQGIAESDKARADARSKAGFEATGFGAEFASTRTPLQKALIEAKTRFAPPPVEAPPEIQGPPVSAKPVATTSAPTLSSGGLNVRFSPGLLSKPPQELTDLRERSRQEPLERAKKERDKRYASMPDLFPSLGSDSTVNKLYKSALTRYTR